MPKQHDWDEVQHAGVPSEAIAQQPDNDAFV